MAERQLAAVIMAGGSGTRFWPLSTPREPKQFLKIGGQRTMLQETWRRLDGIVPPERRLIVTGAEYVELSARGLEGLDPRNLIGEPTRLDTAAAAILGTALAAERWKGVTVLTLPADHLIEPAERFAELIAAAVKLAEERQALCTIGIPPLYPADSYGYIERGETIDIGGELRAYSVRRFAEKPTTAEATVYLKQGTFYWNAGIFIWPAEVLLEEARRYLPEHADKLTALAQRWGQSDFDQQMAAVYGRLERVSIDVGVMERTSRAAVVEANFQWSDLGGWMALGDMLEAEIAGNRVHGQVILEECRDSIAYNSQDGPPLICVGVENLVIVHTASGTLVCHKDRVEGIKRAVNRLYE